MAKLYRSRTDFANFVRVKSYSFRPHFVGTRHGHPDHHITPEIRIITRATIRIIILVVRRTATRATYLWPIPPLLSTITHSSSQHTITPVEVVTGNTWHVVAMCKSTIVVQGCLLVANYDFAGRTVVVGADSSVLADQTL